MSPEIVAGLLQFGAMGLLAMALYFGLQSMARKDEIIAEALKRCMEAHEKLEIENRELRQQIERQ
jgi:hypothetical protein